MAWPIVTFNGQQYRQREGMMLIPLESSGAAIIMVKEDGGAVANGITSIEQGPPGLSPTFAEAATVIPLANDDPTPDSATLTQIAPPTSESGGIYKWTITSRSGPKGDDGATVWDPTTLSESPVAGQIPAVTSGLDGFELVPQKFPEVFYPGTIADIGSGNQKFTVAQIPIPARPYARRVRAGGYQVITGEAADVRVDLLARLNNADSGNIVGRCQGIAQVERLMMDPGKPIESGTSADTYDQIAANASAIVYIRTERSNGSTTYIGSASQAKFWAETLPL